MTTNKPQPLIFPLAEGFKRGTGSTEPHAGTTHADATQESEPSTAPGFATTKGATVPAWAAAMIVAELESDQSDMQTDYFNTRTERTILLGFSKHTRDLFAEMRKAAATFPPTAHLGPGCDVWTVSVEQLDDAVENGNGRGYWKGDRSHWHGDLFGEYSAMGKTFTTEDDARAWIAAQPATEPHAIHFGDQCVRFGWKVSKTSIEHREKYSMGGGYYLKASGAYSTGWLVCKRAIRPGDRLDGIDVYDPAPAQPAPVEPAAAPVAVVEPAPITIRENVERGGIEIHFLNKPSADVRERLKDHGWRWSRFSSCWYRKDTPAARAFAQALAGVDPGIIAADRAFARSSKVED